jgi:DNA-binding NarL/FixJ family response regulator
MLTHISNLQIVGEASDGSEAVRKAVVLKPDLILLDRSSHPEWHGSRSATSGAGARIQDNFLESGIFF